MPVRFIILSQTVGFAAVESQMDWQRVRPKSTEVTTPSKGIPDHRIDI